MRMAIGSSISKSKDEKALGGADILGPQSGGCVKRTRHDGLWCVSRTRQNLKSSDRTMPPSPAQITPEEAVRRVAQAREALVGEVHKVIIGQDEMIEQMLICVFARGHCLTIGVPGLAKTLTVSTLGPGAAAAVHAHPVHARPDAQRHHRHRDHRPGPGLRQAEFPVRPRAGLLEHRAGRRDQPHAAEDPGGAVAGDAGTRGHGGRQHLSSSIRRSSSWPRRTRSSRKAPTRCPRPSWTASCSRSTSAIRRGLKSGRS